MLVASILPATVAGAQAPVPPPGTTTGSAGSTPVFGLRPGLYGRTTLEQGHYQYAVDPPGSVDDSVTVFNFSDREIELRIYAADMVQTLQGGLAPSQAQDKQKGVGLWLKPEVSSIKVPANGRQRVGMRLEVPRFTAAGDHVGAIVAAKPPDEGAEGLVIETRVALTVRVRIPGEANLNGEVGPLTVSNAGGDRKFKVQVRNTGNLLFTTDGKIEIRQGSGVVATIPVKPDAVYVIPGGRAEFEATWTKTPLFGGRTAVAKFGITTPGDETKQIDSGTLSLSFFSWLVLGLVLLVIVGSIGWVLVRRRRQRAADLGGAGERVETAGDATAPVSIGGWLVDPPDPPHRERGR